MFCPPRRAGQSAPVGGGYPGAGATGFYSHGIPAAARTILQAALAARRATAGALSGHEPRAGRGGPRLPGALAAAAAPPPPAGCAFAGGTPPSAKDQTPAGRARTPQGLSLSRLHAPPDVGTHAASSSFLAPRGRHQGSGSFGNRGEQSWTQRTRPRNSPASRP